MDIDADLDELLDRWEEAREQGLPVSAGELCQGHPHLLAPLQAKIAAIERIDGCLKAHEQPQPESAPDVDHRRSDSVVTVDARFVDLRFHDRGGLGVVYLARDQELHRDVAVKFLHQKIARNPYDRQRFHEEAEITGRLDHPGVVPVYALGRTADGQPFYAMRFIRGDTFDDMIKKYHVSKTGMDDGEQRVAMRKLLAQVVAVCRTIGYAHTRGIVHRDIKPKNIMCGKYGETLVVDWGLAAPFARQGLFRVEDETTLVPRASSSLASSRETGGTPVYMSPEQAASHGQVGPLSDIYCLGGVLYKAITGRLAFDGDSPQQVRALILKGEFVPPRKIDRQIPGPLESICLKAMSLLPSARYETASAMADDLETYLADAPVPSYRYSLLERCARTIRRHQKLFAGLLIGTAILAMCALSAATVFFQLQRQTKRSLDLAAASQQDTLNLTCSMAARGIQYNLESRLIALENLAAGLHSIDAFAAGNEQQARTMLANHRDASEKRLPSVSWFLLDRQGKLICRAADSNVPAPESFARWTRPYFHGQDQQLNPDIDERPKPLDQPFLGPVFIDRYEGRQLCSLSVPVTRLPEVNSDLRRISPDSSAKAVPATEQTEVVAVLVMTIRMDQFDPLFEQHRSGAASSRRFSSLVETRGDLKGALLYHPGLQALADQPTHRCTVSASILESLSRIDCTTTEPQPIDQYVDQVGGPYSGPWNTAALPVHIRSRNGDPVSCGWLLLVQSRPIAMEGD